MGYSVSTKLIVGYNVTKWAETYQFDYNSDHLFGRNGEVNKTKMNELKKVLKNVRGGFIVTVDQDLINGDGKIYVYIAFNKACVGFWKKSTDDQHDLITSDFRSEEDENEDESEDSVENNEDEADDEVDGESEYQHQSAFRSSNDIKVSLELAEQARDELIKMKLISKRHQPMVIANGVYC